MNPRVVGAMCFLFFAAPVLASKSLPGNESLVIDEAMVGKLVSQCESCHGPGGRSTREDVPALAGRPAKALVAEMERFYFYERLCPDVPVDRNDKSKGHMSMCDVTNQINKQEAKAVAEYFEAQPGQ